MATNQFGDYMRRDQPDNLTGDRPMAAKHIFTPMVIAILAITGAPASAQIQQPDMTQLKAEAQTAFNIISSDKLKIQTFCEMADLGNQLDQADRAHETKKTEEISQKLDELERKLPEYSSLVDGLADVDPNSQDAQEIGSIILKLDELCH